MADCCGDDGASLEAQADRLLRRSKNLGKQAGCYTEVQVSQARNRREVSIEDIRAITADVLGVIDDDLRDAGRAGLS